MVVMQLDGVDVVHEGKLQTFATEEEGEAFLRTRLFPALKRIGRPGGPRWGYAFVPYEPPAAPEGEP